jgi:hypothetical protein
MRTQSRSVTSTPSAIPALCGQRLNTLTAKFEIENKSRWKTTEIKKYLKLIKLLKDQVKAHPQPKGTFYCLLDKKLYDPLPAEIKKYLLLTSKEGIEEKYRVNWLYIPFNLYASDEKVKNSKIELTSDSSELAYHFIGSLSGILKKILAYHEKPEEKKEEVKREEGRETKEEKKEEATWEGIEKNKGKEIGSPKPLPCDTGIARVF